MAERIPHLSALRTFDAVARHMSFQAAATELGLTPSAVSHQIRGLEAYLGMKLFERRTRAIALTAAGSALQPGLDIGFRSIERAVRQVRSLDRRSAIVISAGPAIVAKWLAPRLYVFEELEPHIEVRITTSMRTVDLTREDVDVALRHGPGKYPGLNAVRLFGEAYTPICAPQLIEKSKQSKGLKSVSDLRHHRLLHDDAAAYPGPAPGWPEWLQEAGAKGVDGTAGRRFKQTHHALQATIDGAGVLLGRIAIAAPDLAAGRLVQPFELALPSTFSYWFLTSPGRETEKPIARFLAWLQDEVENMPCMPK